MVTAKFHETEIGFGKSQQVATCHHWLAVFCNKKSIGLILQAIFSVKKGKKKDR